MKAVERAEVEENFWACTGSRGSGKIQELPKSILHTLLQSETNFPNIISAKMLGPVTTTFQPTSEQVDFVLDIGRC